MNLETYTKTADKLHKLGYINRADDIYLFIYEYLNMIPDINVIYMINGLMTNKLSKTAIFFN